MMKRLILILMLCLLLAGCKDKKVEQPTEPAVTEPTNGWYEQGSTVETETKGAVRSYSVQTDTVTDINMIGDHVALFEKGETTKITVMETKEGTILGQIELGREAVGLQVIYNAIAYYQSETNEAVFLDYNLTEVNRFKLPDELEGVPVFALDSSEVYYCVGENIRAFDTTLNISRMVRSHVCKQQSLNGVLFGGMVISGEMEYEDGSKSNFLISAKTGEMLRKDENLTQMSTNQTKYIGLRRDGIVNQYIFGTVDGDGNSLKLPQNINIAPSVKAGGIATYESDENGTAKLAFYETANGMKTAAITVKNIGQIQIGTADGKGLWILANKDETQTLYYWTFEKSKVEEEVSYLTPLYTAENPDEEGLKAVKKAADELGTTYHVDVRVWDDALFDDCEFDLTAEYQTVAIEQMLAELEPVLASYPERFLDKSSSNKLRICVVRKIDGAIKGVQCRHNNDPCIILAIGCDVKDEFTKAMGYVLNSRVLGKSPLFDDWTKLNPEEFVYGETVDAKYLEGENRAFVDETSMNSVTDDRSILFYHAMKADNAEMFTSSVMQEKLILLCRGIRDAWRWEEEKEAFPWEQYLNESLAAKE